MRATAIQPTIGRMKRVAAVDSTIACRRHRLRAAPVRRRFACSEQSHNASGRGMFQAAYPSRSLGLGVHPFVSHDVDAARDDDRRAEERS